MVQTVMNILLNVLLIGSLLGFLLVIVGMARQAPTKLETALRVAAMFAGAMVTVGASAAGVNYAEFTVDSLAGARPASAAAHLAAAVVPALAGAGLGFYMVRRIRSHSLMAMRILGFVGMLATTAFIQVYALAADTKGIALGATAIPNIVFTAGVILAVTFGLRPEDEAAGQTGTAAALLRMIQMRRGGQSAAAQALTPSGTSDPFRGL